MSIGKENNFVSVVAYLHNNEEMLPEFLDYITATLEQHFKKYEIIFVDDFSVDGSTKVIQEYIGRIKEKALVSIIHMSRYHGVERAMQAGIDLSIGDFVFEFDNVYLDYPKDLLMQIYYKSLEGFDIVAAAPEHNSDFFSNIFYRIYNRYAVAKRSTRLRRETFRILSRRAINRVKSLNKTIPYRKVVYHNCGLKVSHISYSGAGRRHYAKEESENRRGLASDSLILFTDVVLKLAIMLSVVFMVFTLGVGAFALVDYLSPDKPVEGWTTLMLFLAAGFSGVFILMSIILKYLSVILNMVFEKQVYLIQSIDKLTN